MSIPPFQSIIACVVAAAAIATTSARTPDAAMHGTQAGQVLTSTVMAQSESGCVIARCAPPQSRKAFEDLFTHIMRIPHDVLQRGDAATQAWLRDDPRHATHRRVSFEFSSTADPLRCVGSVGAILIGVLVPAVKILKIRALIKDLGGVFAAARLLVGAGTAAEKAEAITTLTFLVAELVGIAGVRDNCFS